VTPAPIDNRGRVRRVARNLRLGVGLAWSASRAALIKYCALGVINAAMPPAAVYLGATLVNGIAQARTDGTGVAPMVPVLLALWIVSVVQRSVSAYINYGRNEFVRRVELEAERRLLQHAAQVDLGHFDDSDWHDRLSRAKRDLSWRPGDLTWSVLGLSGNVVSILLMAALLASLHVVLVALAALSAALTVTLEGRATTKMYAFFYRETPEEREREYLADLLVQSKTAKDVRAYVIADYLLGRHARLSESLFGQRAKMYRAGARTSMLTGVITGTTLALAYAFVAIRGAAGAFDPGGVVLVIGAFTSVTVTLGNMSSTFVAVDQHTTFLDDYFSFLASEPLVYVSPAPRLLPPTFDDGIVFDRVTFTYPGGTEPALVDFSLTIRSGELMALVGDNGAGKSTIVKLLLRFYDVDRGSIRVGGIDVREVDPDALRERLGVLFQDFASYELSIRENVTMGRPAAAHSDTRVIAALRDARSDWLLAKMPDGLDSRVGRLFEGGHDLSGGEWQRLALARLMYRGADVWILDEPTASLDPEAESAIFAELRDSLEGRIGVVISHRFSTARIADRIAVISNGRVAELGTHDQLLRANRRYAELFELQAAGYR
jgi:ATP-binding cassette subfamily B protein